MNETTFLDRLHARAQGRLTERERTELERELAADPARAALAEDYRLVHALTALAPDPSAASRTSFEELEPRLASSRAWRPAAAAAALLLAGVAGFLAGRRGGTDGAPLILQAIELAGSRAGAQAGHDLPREWSEYDPRGPLGVSFLTRVEEAEQLAHAAHRPLLVFGFYPGCPMAAALDAKVFTDPRVVELAERTVPVRIDLTQLPEAEQRALTARGYPFLEVWREDGTPAHALSRSPDPERFVESLHDGLEKSDATGEQPPWAEVRGLAQRFVATRTDELEGRLAAAERGYHALLEDALTSVPIAERASAGLRRLADEARELLLEAGAAASSDAHEARRLLERALGRFAGTRFEPDLRGALERLERDGRFPPLATARRST